MSRSNAKIFEIVSVLLLGVLGSILAARSLDARPLREPVATAVISGNVTADRGDVRAFRVRAKDKVHQISYTVFTNKGRYNVYNLPPSTYELQVREPGFDSSVQIVEIDADETRIVDLTLKATPTVTSKIKLVEYNELYPPGPARDILEKNCSGCHGYQEGGLSPYHFMPARTENEWAEAMIKMFWVPGVFPSPT